MLQTLPACAGECGECFLETLAGRHPAIVPGARLPVAGKVERRQHFTAKPGILFQHRFNGFRCCIFVAGKRAYCGQTGQFVHHEQHVLQWRDIAHWQFLKFGLLLAQFGNQLRHDFKQVANDAVIGHAEDRCFRVLVDGDNRLRIFHAGQMLDRARNADCDI
jgi:hypothetical protein